jgi:NAD(P)-dependent dehydrogenase (short-subunit alcohol dehydrogenase family)
MGTLEGRTIVITGGSLGIGLAVAERCAHDGAAVVIAARGQADMDAALEKLKGISSARHSCYRLDVGELTQVRAFAEWIAGNYGTIDGLVNCAGVYGPIGKTPDVDLEHFEQAIKINLLGTVYMCSAFAPLIKGTRRKIVNYSGGGAATPFARYSAYASSKAAIVRFTENLSIEMKEDGFDINCVAPGFVITRLHQQTLAAGKEQAGDGFFESTVKQVNSGGVPPEKAAALTSFLLSAASDGITGKFISAPWDPWDTADFQDLMRTDTDAATLRRIDNKMFIKKP